MNYNINDKKYHYVYKITNDIDDRYYIGKHSTNDLNDGYMGSGLILQKLFKKYGIEHFKKDILKLFESSDDAYKYEGELVNNETLKDKNCLNIQLGGITHKISNNPESKSIKLRNAGKNKIILKNIITNKCIKISKYDLKNYDTSIYVNPTKGLIFSAESRKKMSIAKQGYTPWNKGLKGYKNPNHKLSELGRLSIIRHNKERVMSSETRQKISNTVKNRKYMYKEINQVVITKFVEEKDQAYMLQNGWQYGRASLKNRIVIHKFENNIYVNKCIDKNDLKLYLDNGWIIGKKLNKNNNYDEF